MIVFITEVRDRYVIVHLHGQMDERDSAEQMGEHVWRLATRNPTLLDLTGLTPIDSPATRTLVSLLDASPRNHDVVLIHQTLEARRLLRAMDHPVPVVPDVASALQGRFSATTDQSFVRAQAS